MELMSIFDITETEKSVELKSLRKQVHDRCKASLPTIVCAVGSDSNKKSSAKRNLYKVVLPGPMRTIRLTNVNGETIFVSSNCPDRVGQVAHEFKRLPKAKCTVRTLIELVGGKLVKDEQPPPGLQLETKAPLSEVCPDRSRCEHRKLPDCTSKEPIDELNESPSDEALRLAKQAHDNDDEDPDLAFAFPTESRERQKLREKHDKEKGITREKNKVKKHVEEHFDDCGNDLCSLLEGDDISQAEVMLIDNSHSFSIHDYSYIVDLPVNNMMFRGPNVKPSLNQAIECENIADLASFSDSLHRPYTELDLTNPEYVQCRHLNADGTFLYTVTKFDRTVDQSNLIWYVANYPVMFYCAKSSPKGSETAMHGRICEALLADGRDFAVEHGCMFALMQSNSWPSVTEHKRTFKHEIDDGGGSSVLLTTVPNTESFLKCMHQSTHSGKEWNYDYTRMFVLMSQIVQQEFVYPEMGAGTEPDNPGGQPVHLRTNQVDYPTSEHI